MLAAADSSSASLQSSYEAASAAVASGAGNPFAPAPAAGAAVGTSSSLLPAAGVAAAPLSDASSEVPAPAASASAAVAAAVAALAGLPAADLANARLALQPRAVRPAEVVGEAFQRLLSSGAAARAEGSVLVGYLYKCTRDPGARAFSAWAWRFVLVGGGEARWARSEFEDTTRGSFALRELTAAAALGPECGRANALELRLRSEKTFRYSFESAEARDCWLGLLRAVVALRAAGELGGDGEDDAAAEAETAEAEGAASGAAGGAVADGGKAKGAAGLAARLRAAGRALAARAAASRNIKK